MRRIYILLVCIFVSIVSYSQAKIINQTDNTITVEKTYVAVETYKKTSTSAKECGGSFGIAPRCNYNFYDKDLDFGGSIYYNFASKSGDSKIGVFGGADYCGKILSNTYRIDSYVDVRGGLILCKYVGLGVVYRTSHNRWGACLTLFLPITEHFGLQGDCKWVYEDMNKGYSNGFSLGGGLIFYFPTKLN